MELEQLERVARGILDDRQIAAHPVDDLGPESGAGGPEALDFGGEVVDR
jgi:hypothetical protein